MIYSGCGTDHLVASAATSLDDVIRAYLEQLHAIQKLGGRIILMASRALVRAARSPEDYIKVYERVLAEADHPVILHWLGDMFDPALKGYWGSEGFEPAMETCLCGDRGHGRPRSMASRSRCWMTRRKSSCGAGFRHR